LTFETIYAIIFIEMKRDGRRLNRDVLEDLRISTVRRISRGTVSVIEEARRIGLSRQIIYRWLHRFRKAGTLRVLRRRHAPGALPKLTAKQIAGLKECLKHPATMHGFLSELWSLPRIGDLIRQRYGVRFAKSGVWLFLRREGYSSQRPIRRALERNEGKIRRWLREEYPRILAFCQQKRAILYFADESGVRTDHVSGRCWAERGHPRVVRRPGHWERLNMLSAVSPRGRMLFRTDSGKVTSRLFIRFLEQIIHAVAI
jgi:transposase